jgi:hypothetical protein
MKPQKHIDAAFALVESARQFHADGSDGNAFTDLSQAVEQVASALRDTDHQGRVVQLLQVRTSAAWNNDELLAKIDAELDRLLFP